MLRKTGRFLKRLIRWCLLALLIYIVVMSFVNSMRSKYTRVFDAYTVARGDISTELSYDTNLALLNSRTYTTQTTTKVHRTYVSEGDTVQKGARLMRLNNGTVIKADFDGYVNRMFVSAGDKVNAGDSLVQVADLDHMRASIRVTEYDIPYFYIGRDCTVTFAAYQRTIDEKIETVDFIGSEGNGMSYYTATVDVNGQADVYPGMQVTVKVTDIAARDTLWLPKDALSFDEHNSAFVYLKSADGSLEERPVELGTMNDERVEILSGLQMGETVYKEVDSSVSTRDMIQMMRERSESRMEGAGFGGQGDFGGQGGFVPDRP